jgi:predicted nucleic acid-binding protein
VSTFLIDSNVLIDVATDDDTWGAWSGATLAWCADHGRLAVNPIIYAEVAAGFDRIERLDEVLPRQIFLRLPLPWDAGFLAGRSFVAYRRRGGTRTTPLPDFYIGAHAAVHDLTLVTRDPSRYRTYFPRVRLVAPTEA